LKTELRNFGTKEKGENHKIYKIHLIYYSVANFVFFQKEGGYFFLNFACAKHHSNKHGFPMCILDSGS